MPYLKYLIIGFVILITVGCERTDQGELSLLMKDDPQFQQMVQAKQQAKDQISQLQSEMQHKKQNMNEQIRNLRSGYQTDADERQKQINFLKANMKDTRDAYMEDLRGLRNYLDTKKGLQEELSQALADAQDIMSRKETIGLSTGEIDEWQNRIIHLKERLDPLTKEINELEAQSSLRRKKLKYL